jgi:hypothetical protein
MSDQREIATDKQDWRLDAKCQSTTLSKELIAERDRMFFLGRGGKANRAKKFCSGEQDGKPCDATRSCLIYALYYGEEEGIWGGMTPDERRNMPPIMKDLLLMEAADLIDTSETRDPLQWLPIIFPGMSPEEILLDAYAVDTIEIITVVDSEVEGTA